MYIHVHVYVRKCPDVHSICYVIDVHSICYVIYYNYNLL